MNADAMVGPAAPATDAAASLERGAVLTFQPCPFLLPAPGDRTFLCEQRLRNASRPCIGYDPRSSRLRGFARQSAAQANHLRELLVQLAEGATRWLGQFLPPYAGGWEVERIALHPDEEATRKLLPLQRNDLLHIDAPPRPTHGRRLLRLFVNLDAIDARVADLADLRGAACAYGADVGLPAQAEPSWWQPLRQGVVRLLRPHAVGSSYDDFLHRFHDFLKQHDAFQDRAPKKCWHFPPECAWLVFTDGLSHAELRGRHVFEVTYLIARETLVCPEHAPINLLQRAMALPGAHAA